METSSKLREINLNTDRLSADMKTTTEENYFPKLNSVVKYANTGSKYSNPATVGLNKKTLSFILVLSLHYRNYYGKGFLLT